MANPINIVALPPSTTQTDNDMVVLFNATTGNWNSITLKKLKEGYLGFNRTFKNNLIHTPALAVAAGNIPISLLTGQTIPTNNYIHIVGGKLVFKTADDITLMIRCFIFGTTAGGGAALKAFKCNVVEGGTTNALDCGSRILNSSDEAQPEGRAINFMLNSKETATSTTNGFDITISSLTGGVSASISRVSFLYQVIKNG